MGMTADEFNNAIQEWIKMYKIKKSTVSKSSTKDRNYMPIGFFLMKQNKIERMVFCFVSLSLPII